MRIPPNLKYVLFSLLAIGLIILGVLYLPRLIPNIGKIVIGVMTAGMCFLIFFALFKPMLTFLYARADGIFTVYIDQSKKGIHVFSYHINSGSRYSSHGTREIQHYYILLETGKLFYRSLFTHTMQPMSGRSGWGGFISFEENVLQSPLLGRSLEKLSAKAKMQLQLGQEIKAQGDHHFDFDINGKHIVIKKFDTATDEGIKISCTDTLTKTMNWQKKI